MSENIKELADRLRLATVVETFIGPDGQSDHTTELGMDAADALEAMAGEVEGLKRELSQVPAWRSGMTKRAEAAESERDRLAGEVERETKAAGYWMERSCAAENERDRLKAALASLVEEVELSEAWVKHSDAHEAARKALGGDAP